MMSLLEEQTQSFAQITTKKNFKSNHHQPYTRERCLSLDNLFLYFYNPTIKWNSRHDLPILEDKAEGTTVNPFQSTQWLRVMWFPAECFAIQ